MNKATLETDDWKVMISSKHMLETSQISPKQITVSPKSPEPVRETALIEEANVLADMIEELAPADLETPKVVEVKSEPKRKVQPKPEVTNPVRVRKDEPKPMPKPAPKPKAKPQEKPKPMMVVRKPSTAR